MKIKLIASLFLLALTSCQDIKEEDNVPTSKLEALTALGDLEEDSVKNEKAAGTKSESSDKSSTKETPLLIARGSEPGWYAEFFKARATLVLDYGKDTLLVKHDFTTISTDKNFTAQISGSSNNRGEITAESITINLTSKACTEASGENKEKSITLKYKGKDYKGCAGLK
ncbi:MAG: hypothetical protein JWO32_507 [Bacteroidetes bacterium]|nr:hypothetical protein [Bacteroidota bacterium]